MVSKIFIMAQYLQLSLQMEEQSSSEFLHIPTQQPYLTRYLSSLDTQADPVRSEESKGSWVDHLELLPPPEKYVFFHRNYLGMSVKTKLTSHPAKQHAYYTHST